MEVGGALRWGRAALLAAVVLGAGVLGHAGADGLLPGALALLSVYAATTVACAALLGRPASRRRVVGLLVAGQGLVHLVLSAAAGHAGEGAAAPGPVPTGAAPAASLVPPLPAEAVLGTTSADGRRVGSLQEQWAALDPGAAAAGPGLDGSTVSGSPLDVVATAGHALGEVVVHALDHALAHAPMAGAHLLAAVLAGLWLAGGEQALAALVALARAVLGVPPLALPPVVDPRGPRRRPDRSPARPRVHVLARVSPRRGPPLLAG